MFELLYSKNEKYSFLSERLSKEPHIEEVLAEIELFQKNWLRNHSGELATVESLNESRNIKVPLTQKRLMNIQYLVDLLMKGHPSEIKPVCSFKFTINPENKNLTIDEKTEITMLMKETDYNQLQLQRDKESTESLLGLLQSFRLFNLTKLIKKSKNRNHLTQIVKSQLGSSIFTFKNYSYDKNSQEIAEDYCFHKSNYDAVKSKIDLEGVRRIIEQNEPAINRRLKNFGILNATVSDYRDNKLDYILNILTGELLPSIDKKGAVDVKNFKSLRDCINKVDKLLDPAIMLDGEIMKHLQENFITTDKDIISLFAEMTPESLNKWETEKTASGKIITHQYNNMKYIIDPSQFLKKYDSYIKTIIYHDEGIDSESQRDSNIYNADMLTDAGTFILQQEQYALKLFSNIENINSLKKLISEYQDFKRTLAALRTSGKNEPDEKESRSILAWIANSIMMLFSRKSKTGPAGQEQKEKAAASAKARKNKTELSKETKDLYREISERKAPLLPLSDFIEIKPDNENAIGKLINEMRMNNLKIIIPIYNARQVLYAQRSKKYLISDVEYLMVDPDKALSPETVREYIDSITGYKFKDDTITGSALFSIEKYLMSIYRQNKAKMKREKEKK